MKTGAGASSRNWLEGASWPIFSVALLLALDAGCAGGGECNGAAELCSRRFDEVAFATTHNAMSNEDDGWILPNQHHSLARQLEDGIRGLMLDVHPRGDPPEPTLCHAECGLGSLPLVEGLGIIRKFLDENRGEIITVIFESYVPATDLAAAFDAAGLTGNTCTPGPSGAWPTLGQMVARDQRLVVMTDHDPGTPSWYLDQWKVAWQNPYRAGAPADFDKPAQCLVERGSSENALFVFNHFLTAPFAAADLAEQVNRNPLFIERAERCQAETGRFVNFPTVDFYDIGDLLDVTRALNQLDEAQPAPRSP